MAHKILETVYDNTGNSRSTDIFVKHDTNITTTILDNLEIEIFMYFYRSENDYLSGKSDFTAVDNLTDLNPYKSFLQTLTGAQALTIDPELVNNFTKTHLKTLYTDVFDEKIIGAQSTPPGSPSELDSYLVTATATGDWAGHEDDVARYINSTWTFVNPFEGMEITNETNIWTYTSGTWIES